MTPIIDNRSGFRGFTVDRNAGTFTAPFFTGNQRIPLDPNQTVFNKGRSALDNLYGTSTDPRIKMFPPSVFRTINAANVGLLNNRNTTPSSYAKRMMSENTPNTIQSNTGGFSSLDRDWETF